MARRRRGDRQLVAQTRDGLAPRRPSPCAGSGEQLGRPSLAGSTVLFHARVRRRSAARPRHRGDRRPCGRAPRAAEQPLVRRRPPALRALAATRQELRPRRRSRAAGRARPGALPHHADRAPRRRLREGRHRHRAGYRAATPSRWRRAAGRACRHAVDDRLGPTTAYVTRHAAARHGTCCVPRRLGNVVAGGVGRGGGRHVQASRRPSRLPARARRRDSRVPRPSHGPDRPNPEPLQPAVDVRSRHRSPRPSARRPPP